MTQLTSIFDKDVGRYIEGVIKADDEASLRLEVEEYILTNEVEKRLESFLDAYNNYEGSNGVWVSGFFGSGKSHLLKMLALLLENREIDGATTLDLFLSKCTDNEILRGDLKGSASIPSKSILFNIDQKADVISKTQIDALLAVFVKVFDEMFGYYGKQGHIAQFERDLDSRGLYEQFKTAYQQQSGRYWHQGREQALLESHNIAVAYAQVSNESETSATGVLDKYRSQYKVSIEDFAEQVKTYVDQQCEGFRLNFFIDEVGQYIAENVKLMTNLQTIAESLATKCRGQAWVIVTAQEDMNTVIGEMTQQQGNDFTKIQARFANRMKLTSADVAEVIQKRLLMKNEQGIELLSTIFHEQVNNLKTLFDFADGAQSYKNFKDRDHFIHCYPFIPYQFSLFQSAIQNLSSHNAFEGNFSSVGERSMLGVFQQVAMQIGQHEIGQLATFDLMFEGIRTALKSNIQKAIISAEKNLDNLFAIRLLKALFLVKYVNEFKSSPRNLCILMLESFNQDLPKLRNSIEEALNILEQQTYIQRNGDLYEYLTDVEKDVEVEIKNTAIDSSEVSIELEKIIFDYVIKNRKIRFNDNGQDYAYSRKLDDKLHGREHELTIHVITPFHEHAEQQATLLMQAFGRDELLVLMSADDRIIRDSLLYKQTEKYIRQNITITQQEGIKRILTNKGFQNRERYADLQRRIHSAVGHAKLFIAGSELELAGEDPQSRINKGFYELITRTYPNLKMLHGIVYTEKDIGKCLNFSQDSLFANDSTAMTESELEMLAFIQSNHRGGVRTTVKALVEKFERKPYGWYFAAILSTLAMVCARGKVEVRRDGNILEDKELERTLKNTSEHANTVLEPQIDFSASQIRQLKEFYEDFFDAPPSGSDAKTLGKETGVAIKELINQLNTLCAQTSQYEFLIALQPIIQKLQDISDKPYTWYLTELVRREDEFLDDKEQCLDPLRKFMGGAQKQIYNDAKQFIIEQEPNFSSLNSDLLEKITATLTDPACYKGNQMQQLKSHLDELKDLINQLIDREIEKAKNEIDVLKNRLSTTPEYTELTTEQQQQLLQPFTEFITKIERQKLIAVVRDSIRMFAETEYHSLLEKMAIWAKPKKQESADTKPQTPTNDTAKEKISEPRIEIVAARSIAIDFDKALLTDERDVENYLESMRKALLAEIANGKRIQI